MTIYCNKLITDLGLIMLIKSRRKIVRETPQNTVLHTKLKNREPSAPHLDSSTNMTNLTARNLKPFVEAGVPF